MRTLISFTALFLSVAFLQLGNGTMAALDALSGIREGFTTLEIGMMGSAHFVGFFLGCWLSPRLIGSVGHARSYAVFAAIGAISAIGHPLWIDADFWIALRVMTGFCVAGSYTVIEAWLQARVENENRGQVVGVYRSVDLGASVIAQSMIAVLEPAHYVSYNLLAIICCASLLPMAVTRAEAPQTTKSPRLHLLSTLQASPLGVAGVVVAGVTAASFRMIGPVYGQYVGLTSVELALFLSSFMLGGAIAQIPVGWLADRFDRRQVINIVSLLSILSCVLIINFGTASRTLMLSTTFIFGFFSYPIFSLAAAHANDFTPRDKMVELSAALMFYYGMGAIISPFLASYLIDRHGTTMLFAMIASAHLLLALFGIYRMIRGDQAHVRRRYKYLPRTTFTVGHLFGRSKTINNDSKNR